VIRVAFVLGCLVSIAHAERLEEPPVVACSTGKSWSAVETCLRKLGTPRIIKTLGTAKVVGVRSDSTKPPREHGLILYVERKGTWNLEGFFPAFRDDFELLGFQQVTIGKRRGHRLDIGKVGDIEADSQPAMMRTQHALFCSGQGWFCREIMTACEVLVRGKTRWSFRGTLEYDKEWVTVTGDRRNAGTLCNAPERIPISWH